MRTRASLRRMFGFAGRNRGVGLAASRPRPAMKPKRACGVCGRDPAEGHAKIGDTWYCHGDNDPEPTCYMRSQAALVTPDPKPVKRHKATSNEQTDLKAHFKEACCVATGLPYQHLHHVVLRSEGGDDLIENMAPIINEAHTRFHSRAPGWERVAAAIRTYVYAQPERLAYVLGKLGQDRFDRRYPPLNKQCARVVYRDFNNWLPCNRQSGHRGDCEAA